MSAKTSRDDAVAYVYRMINSGEPDAAMQAAQAILLIEQARAVSVDGSDHADW